MELTKIIFFIIGSFFGIENSRVLADKTTVTINPEEKTIVILQEHIVSLIQSAVDSLKVLTELKAMECRIYRLHQKRKVIICFRDS